MHVITDIKGDIKWLLIADNMFYSTLHTITQCALSQHGPVSRSSVHSQGDKCPRFKYRPKCWFKEIAGPHCRASVRAGANQWKMFYLICHSFQYFHINLLDREKSGVSARCLVHIYLYPDNRSRECNACWATLLPKVCVCMWLWRALCWRCDGEPRCQNDTQPSTPHMAKFVHLPDICFAFPWRVKKINILIRDMDRTQLH